MLHLLPDSLFTQILRLVHQPHVTMGLFAMNMGRPIRSNTTAPASRRIMEIIANVRTRTVTLTRTRGLPSIETSRKLINTILQMTRVTYHRVTMAARAV